MFTIPDIFQSITANVEKVIQGKRDAITLILLCLFSKGHILIEDLPGVGKTLMSKAVARSINTKFSRIQFTPDLLPSDIIGVSIWKPSENAFEFQSGPIFANMILADEINRSSPKTQSALLEAMAENQVTADKTTYPLSNPFMVLATQNPIETYGTYPLLESQLDRFMMVLRVGYPDHASEKEMLDTHQVNNRIDSLAPVVDSDSVLTAIKATAEIHVADSIRNYLVDIANATRNHPNLSIGMSPRATLDLQRISQTYAAFCGRDYVMPDDVQFLVKPTISHRLYSQINTPYSPEEILDEIISQTPVPSVSSDR